MRPSEPDPVPLCLFLTLSSSVLESYRGALALASEEKALRAVARGLSVSRFSPGERPDRISVRHGDPARIGLWFRDATRVPQEEADALARTHLSALSTLKYVTWREAVRDAEALALAIQDLLGRTEARRWRYHALPRGGLVVLGMVAYALDLPHSRIGAIGSEPVLVVDDCALTGYRFGTWLRSTDAREIVFAHLYSVPALRRSIESREHAVRKCLSARDLADRTADFVEPPLTAWREARQARLSPPRYWVGLFDPVSFPWSEPERIQWPVAGRARRAWRALPPELCLGNRVAPGEEPVPIVFQERGDGPWAPGPDVLYTNLDDRVLLASAETGRCHVLEGPGAIAWNALCGGSDTSEVLDEITRRYDVVREAARQDLLALIEELRSGGYLERTRA